MRTLTYYVATTLDGYIAEADRADPTGSLFTVGQDYLAHIVEHYPETLPAGAREALGVTDPGTRFDAVLEGRRSYQIGLDAGVTNAYPHLRHLVFSRTLDHNPDPGVEVVATDPVATVRELKAETTETTRGIWLAGGAELAGALYYEIDELILKVNPVAALAGIPLFAGRTDAGPRRFALRDNVVLDSGVAILTYTATETAGGQR
ncbi:dihydrofolate reductase [Streptomyces sp. ME02-8801-2C]|uniref:dihydrofolate reductase family protein n=1 Tax=Streptomyces sp. ME02-8801-2C TaxID=3028680 RepID=UPI0029A896A1|nr:dihydrofolate reductase [Streptomyces sp. ME02-8801-2C]MDX3458127.1 dihydrofolate reductase [Streptomyces sp. ME02-8801-2C]